MCVVHGCHLTDRLVKIEAVIESCAAESVVPAGRGSRCRNLLVRSDVRHT